MAFEFKLNSNLSYIWVNDETIKEVEETVINGLAVSIINEIRNNRNELPPKDSLIYVEENNRTHTFRVLAIRKEKGGFFSSNKTTISVSYTGKNQEEKRTTNIWETKPKGKFTGVDNDYSQDVMIDDIKVTIVFPTKRMKNKDHSSCEFKTAAIRVLLEQYYDVFRTFPGVGEVLRHSGGFLIEVQKKFFLTPKDNYEEFVEPVKSRSELEERKRNYRKGLNILIEVDGS